MATTTASGRGGRSRKSGSKSTSKGGSSANTSKSHSSGALLSVGAVALVAALAVAFSVFATQHPGKAAVRRHPAVEPFKAASVKELPWLKGEYENRMLWGSYRPGLYFGMRTRQPQGLLTGLMWWDPKRPDFFHNIRHEALERDGMKKFGWLEHDGETYGRQEIWDTDFNISTTMVPVPVPVPVLLPPLPFSYPSPAPAPVPPPPSSHPRQAEQSQAQCF
mmetsp:Transcript_26681/g.74931  ORF Transcript_26681/g.74931 Transcript_26681/m.74931 type:complete len:220 (-) Transcript_26681:1839-2498(-)